MANTPEKIKEIHDKTDQILKKWRGKRGALIMALHEVQGAFGFVPWESLEIVGKALEIPVARIYAVLTFYNYFKLVAPGKYIISICDGTACHIKGSPAVISAFEKELKVKDGGTTADGNFHLQVVRCLGCCGLAPVVVVNGKTYRKVGTVDVPKIIAEWKAA